MKSNRDRFFKIAIISIISILILIFLVAISGILKLIIISALFAYILDPIASFMESRGMSRTMATVSIFLLITIILIISYMIFLPILHEEIKGLKTGFSTEKAEIMITRLETFLTNNLSFLGLRDINLLNKIQIVTSKVGDWIFAHVLDAASIVVSIILIPFMIFFIMKDGRKFKNTFVSLLPNRYFELSLYLLHKINIQIGNYLRGQILDATIVGILAMFALWIIGIKYFILIGIFAGLANIVPYFGPIAGATIAVIVSILQTGGFQLALYVIIAFIIIKLLDDAIILPIVMAKSVHLNPLTVLLAILIGGKLFGILGMLLSVPVTGFIKVVLNESILNYNRYRSVRTT